MSAEDPRRVARLIVFNVYVWILLVVALALAAVPLVDRERAVHLAKAYTAPHAPQETPLDWLQEPVVLVSLVVCVVMVTRLWHRKDRLPYWVLLGAATAWLLWRELPWDEGILGANTFSWAKYLGNHDVPLWGQIVFGGGSILATAAMGVYLLKNRVTYARLWRERRFAISAFLIVLALVALVTAQMTDKHRSTDAVFHGHLSAWDLKDYMEESLELIAYILLLMGTVMAVLEEPRDRPASS